MKNFTAESGSNDFPVCAPLHSVSLLEDAAPSPSFKAHMEMYQEDKNAEVWEPRSICDTSIIVQSCASVSQTGPGVVYKLI